jgi:hypothetical protein
LITCVPDSSSPEIGPSIAAAKVAMTAGSKRAERSFILKVVGKSFKARKQNGSKDRRERVLFL